MRNTKNATTASAKKSTVKTAKPLKKTAAVKHATAKLTEAVALVAKVTASVAKKSKKSDAKKTIVKNLSTTIGRVTKTAAPKTAAAKRTPKTTDLVYAISTPVGDIRIGRVRDVNVRHVAKINDAVVDAVGKAMRGFRKEFNHKGNASVTGSLVVGNDIVDAVKLSTIREIEPRTESELKSYLRSVIGGVFRAHKKAEAARAERKAARDNAKATASKTEKVAASKPAKKTTTAKRPERSVAAKSAPVKRVAKKNVKRTAKSAR